MGIYLNSQGAYTLYKNETLKPYFVDKTKMLEKLFPLVEEGGDCICITRPRRFGKTVMANMIASFFSKACDSGSIFDSLTVAQSSGCREHMNQYPVIDISFHELPRHCRSYEQYIERIEEKLIGDIKKEFSNNTETPLFVYNNEVELAAIVNLVYLSARDSYRVEREDKAGIGYVDFIFYPKEEIKADGIILELKVGDTPENAIQQIKDKKTKKHRCKIEVL